MDCKDCKFAKEIKGCYCLCGKKMNGRVQISKQKQCKHFINKITGGKHKW